MGRELDAKWIGRMLGHEGSTCIKRAPAATMQEPIIAAMTSLSFLALLHAVRNLCAPALFVYEYPEILMPLVCV